MRIHHPALYSSQSRTYFLVITTLRAFLICAAIYIANANLDLGTSPLALSLAAILGVIVAGVTVFSRLRTFTFIFAIFALWILYALFFTGLSAFPFISVEILLRIFNLREHVSLLLGIFCMFSFSTWCFWRFRWVAGAEVLGLIAVGLYNFSGHRQFHFDLPPSVNQLAWMFGVTHLTMLVVIGLVLTLAALVYLVLLGFPGRPIASFSTETILFSRGKGAWYLKLPGYAAVILLLWLVSTRVYEMYEQRSKIRTANGVGEESKKGMSPLGFESALGSTNQPAALVRLEGDYQGNPFSPMLYFREGALSEFNGHEMVNAGGSYDDDVSHSGPGQDFSSNKSTADNRTPLVQSMFLLTDHENAFAVDYPITIRRLKNPEPNRFTNAYRAYSLAPIFSLDSAENLSVGDPSWTTVEREHYTKPHSDQRYSDTAKKITAGLTNPLEQAQAIVSFLSNEATYTLTPNHEVQKDEDPVAPFLFGDLRGYCVHFAHASVYMLRSLGIPARIGTGYLTDLSQSKDGHILLRMSDRHAWAEVFLNGIGWVPFDTKPKKVESHAESPVDMNLLEDLMNMVGPGEEILPEKLTEGEEHIYDKSSNFKIEWKWLGLPALAVFLLLLLTKIWLRWGWLIQFREQSRLRSSYLCVLSHLHDLGWQREIGETRTEFLARVSKELVQSTGALTPHFISAVYGENAILPSRAEIDSLRSLDLEPIRRVPVTKRFLGWINFSSSIAYLCGQKF